MYDGNTHLQLSRATARELSRLAEDQGRALRVARLRRLDRRAQQAVTRARLLRLALN